MFIAWLLAGAAAGGATPPITVQQQFEQASDALGAGKSEEAAIGFRALAARPGISARTRSIALLREGTALVGLGRNEAARQAYVEGLTLASKTDPALKEDRRIALLALGGIYKADYDYAAARHALMDARALSDTPVTQLQALLAFVSVAAFEDNGAASAAIDEALKIAATTKVDKGVDATIHDWRGRVLLNRGDTKGALAEFQIALKDQGGLTEKTDLRDVMVRSDVALAYLVAKNPDKASEYFEMTGEGRLPDGPFATAARMDLPHCGDDIRPDDDAVVEFGIGEDGAVSYADPVYASRQGPLAVSFARAVSNWSWRPSEVAKIPLFYRAVTRVELRCSQAGMRPADLSLLLPDAAAWLTAHGSIVNLDMLTNGAPPGVLREQIDAADKAGDKPIQLIGWLMALAAEPTTDFDERQHLYERAATLAQAESAPPAALVYLDLSAAELKSWRNINDKTQYHQAVRKELARPEVAADLRTASVLRLMLASPLPGGGYEPDTETLLRQVIDNKALAERDPLKVGALVRLASFQAQAGRIDDARAAYLKTGLDAQQCSLVDAQPAVLKMGVKSSDYPIDLVRMSVSGWTRIEFDILPSGETANRRAVMSYPPFMFGDATIKAMAKTRYTQTYRPQGELGCGGASQQFRYQVPPH